MVDPCSGRFLESRYQSLRPGLWGQSDSDQQDRSAGIDINLLGVSVPFDLLPASDPRVRASAEAVLSQNAIGSGGYTFTRWSPDPLNRDVRLTPGDALRHEPSCLATLWMIRYLIRLGRELGDAAAWTRAVTLLENLRTHLGPLGQSVRFDDRTVEDPTRRQFSIPGAWPLHGMLIETLLDLTGLDYDAPDQRFTVSPVLPLDWPRVGFSREFPCGKVGYLLEHSSNGPANYKLSMTGRIRHPVTARFRITCPGLARMDSWESRPQGPWPEFNSTISLITWSVDLVDHELDAEWCWSGPAR